MREQRVVVVPEMALGRRGLGSLGGHLRVRMDVVERKVAPDVAQVGAERRQQLADDRLRLPAVWAFEVPVLHERDRSVLEAPDVVALGIDVAREVEDLLARAENLAGAQRGRKQPDRAEGAPRHQRSCDARGEDPELGLGEALAVEGQAGDQERDREADARDRAAPEEHGPAYGRPGAAEPAARREPRAEQDPEWL